MAYSSARNKTESNNKKAVVPDQSWVTPMASRPRRPAHPLVVLSTTIFFGFLVLILLISGLSYGLYRYYLNSELIAPSVKVLNTDIGGMSATDAAILLHKTWNLEHRIAVSDGINEYYVSPNTIGLSVDPLVTARNAYQISRSGGFLTNLKQLYLSYSEGLVILPEVKFNIDAARSGLEKLTPKMTMEPKNATLKLNGTELEEIPGELGYTINLEDTLTALEAQPLDTMINGSAVIYLKPVSPPVNDLSEVKTQFKEILESSIVVKAYDPIADTQYEWQPTAEEISHWMIIDQGEHGPDIKLNQAQTEGFIQKINNELGPERYISGSDLSSQLVEAVDNNGRINAEIKYKPTAYSVKKGDTLLKIGWNLGMPFWKIVEANPGIDPDNVIAGTELTIPAKDELLPLPVIPNKRIRINISDQKLWVFENGELIGKHLISTGIDKSPTQPGVFQVQTHSKNAYASVWDLYMPNFLGIYESWPGFMNGIHGLPTLSNGTRLWENILGRPASYGCIILDLDTAKWLYNWADNGVVVVIEE